MLLIKSEGFRRSGEKCSHFSDFTDFSFSFQHLTDLVVFANCDTMLSDFGSKSKSGSFRTFNDLRKSVFKERRRKKDNTDVVNFN